MATDALSRSSSLSLDNYGAQSSRALDQIIQKYIEEAVAMVPEPTSSTGCLLTDIGNSLIQATTIMTQLAEELVRGEHIQENCRKLLEENEAENDFSELDYFDYFNKTHAALRNMLKTLQTASSTVREQWAQAPRPPVRTVEEFVKTNHNPGSSAISQSPPIQISQLPQLQRSLQQLPLPVSTLSSPTTEQWQAPTGSATPQLQRQNSTASSADFSVFNAEETIGEPINLPNVDMASLKVRGKGTYTCPYKFGCKKGGVLNGQLVVFERNCVFRAHLQKHERPFKCPLPGCPNKGGFARIDQLKRHQMVVKHDR